MSLSLAYWNVTGTSGWAFVTMLYGMPKGNPPGSGPKSGCRSRLAESMLRSQAALWAFTGSWEMSVFQMLLAGNIGQFGAPGTVVPPAAGLVARGGRMAAWPLPVPATGAWASLAARTVPGEAPGPCRGPVPVPCRGGNGGGAARRQERQRCGDREDTGGCGAERASHAPHPATAGTAAGGVRGYQRSR